MPSVAHLTADSGVGVGVCVCVGGGGGGGGGCKFKSQLSHINFLEIDHQIISSHFHFCCFKKGICQLLAKYMNVHKYWLFTSIGKYDCLFGEPLLGHKYRHLLKKQR